MAMSKGDVRTAGDAEELFLVSYRSRSSSEICQKYATRHLLDFMQEHKNWYTVEGFRSVGRLWPESAVVTCTDTSYRMCYATATYRVDSDRELADDDFDILRAQYLFLDGQENGAVVRSYKDGNKFIYLLHSTCDSSD
jgi:hypothetical protein